MWYGICFWKIVIEKYVFKVYYRCSKNKIKKMTYTSAFESALAWVLLNYIDPIPILELL